MPTLFPPKPAAREPKWGVVVEQEANGDINFILANEDRTDDDLFGYIDRFGKLHLLPFIKREQARSAGLSLDGNNCIVLANP